jgi:hypothetical protein
MHTQARPDPTRNIRPGAVAPAGIYVVSHRYPSHALPHEVTISVPIVLPACSYCSSPMPIEDCDFFQFRVGYWQANSLLIARRPVVLFRSLARVRLKFGHWFGSSLTLIRGLKRYWIGSSPRCLSGGFETRFRGPLSCTATTGSCSAVSRPKLAGKESASMGVEEAVSRRFTIDRLERE